MSDERLAGEEIHARKRVMLRDPKTKKFLPTSRIRRDAKILKCIEQGMTLKETAKAVGLNGPSSVHKIVRKESFQAKKKEFENKIIDVVRAEFEENARIAVNKIVKLAKHGKPDERIQLDAAKEILYQIGCKPVEVVETRKRDYTPEEAASALKTVQELEKVAARLGTKKSRFLLMAQEVVTPTPPPGAISESRVEDSTDGNTGTPKTKSD